jgi:hypothetical protein
MIDNNKRNNNLSISNYKDRNNNIIDPSKLDEKEKIGFHLTFLMKDIITILEMSVPQERNFTIAKYEVMAKFHSTL